jgi:hypothetical protein
MKRAFAPLALGMVALYLTLAVGAAGCLFQLPGHGVPAHHHHHSHVAHSAFCAWACQANPTISVLVDNPAAVILPFVALLVLVRTSLTTRITVPLAHPRAPPHSRH